jgi:AcrR family transcriptional regulator
MTDLKNFYDSIGVPLPQLRETKQARSSQTQGKLLDAAIAELAATDPGHVTMQAIAARAGVSRGAIQHLYGGRRVQLMVAVAVELYARYVARFEPISQPGLTPQSFVDLLWDVVAAQVRNPEGIALINIWISMRGDAGLRAELEAAFEEMDGKIADSWRLQAKRLGISEEVIMTLRFFHRSVMRGIAVEKLLRTDPAHFDSVIKLSRAASHMLLSQQDFDQT